jgi:uncharacterized protein (TIGR00369 family)
VSDTPEITELVRGHMPLCNTLGMRLFGDAEEVDATLTWSPELCTAGGILHGGILMALADSAGAVCAFFNMPEGSTTATIESKTNFLGAVRSGMVRARSRPLHVGKTTVVVETDILDESGRLVARTMQTQAILSAA